MKKVLVLYICLLASGCSHSPTDKELKRDNVITSLAKIPARMMSWCAVYGEAIDEDERELVSLRRDLKNDLKAYESSYGKFPLDPDTYINDLVSKYSDCYN